MRRRTVGRRQFLARGALAVAALAGGARAYGQMGGGGGGGGGGTTIVDPPVSGPLLELPTARGEALLDERVGSFTRYTLEARIAPVSVHGAGASAMVYEDRLSPASGRFVAPLIRASPGERIRLRFRNGLPAASATNLLGHERYPTNVHVHGLHVSPGADAMSCLPADDVHRKVDPGGELVFDYDLARQRPGSIGLYHPHLHGTVAEQMWNGLVGGIDVADGGIDALAPYRATVLLLKDVTILNGAPAPYTTLSEYMHGKEGDTVLVNGQVNPLLSAQRGEVIRLRILNVSNARFYRVSLQAHAMYVVGADGGLLDRPSPPQGEILLSPGERVDVLVPVSRTRGDYKLLALPYARRGNMASPQVTLLTLRAGGTATSQPLPGTIDPDARRIADDPALPRARFTLSMGHGRGYINGISFDVVDGAIRASEHHSRVGTDEIWEIVNDSGMDHPWHQHVNDAQLLSMSGGDASIGRYASLYTGVPAWKDTIVIPKWGSATFRIPVKDFGGMTMFHCHILEHEDVGMMGMWHLMPMDAGGCSMPPMPM